MIGCGILLCLSHLLGLVLASNSPDKPFQPLKLPYQDLVGGTEPNRGATVLEALQHVGMVSITNVPHLKELKQSTLSWNMHLCSQESTAAKSNHYPDGTLRRTLATHSTASGARLFHHNTDSTACQTFSEASQRFREVVNHVTTLFSSYLSSLLLQVQDEPLPYLVASNNSFATFADIVNNGEHLEHFHSYQRLQESNRMESLNPKGTIELHTDQGLLLVFAPGRMAHQDPDRLLELSTGFTVELSDGTLSLVEFDEDDDLVVVLGDGVNQSINPRLPRNQRLRPLPHTLALPVHPENQARVWYGRMVLPPSTAFHPQLGITFGALREALVHASNANASNTTTSTNVLTVGCSVDTWVARQLEETSCEADSLYCWHRCMKLTDYNVSEEICHEQGKEIFCIDLNGRLWDGSHGNFHPGCATNQSETTAGTVMYMFGFRFFLDGERPYLNFFLESWTLNTKPKYVGAMIAVFIMAIMLEGLAHLRQSLVKRARSNRWSDNFLHNTTTLLFGFQELVSFLLMLTIMMFSAEFLIMAVTGLATGHILFPKQKTLRNQDKREPELDENASDGNDPPLSAAATSPICVEGCLCSD